MSKLSYLEKLLNEANFEWKNLSDVARIKNGKDHKSLGEGKFPVYGSGGIMRYADNYAYNKSSVLIPRKGSLGNLFFVDVPFWTVDTIFYTEIDEAQIRPKYLYYFLTTVGLGDMNQAGGVPSQTQSVLNKLKIPVPCPENPEKSLAIQAEIVRILDKFTELTAEITAELTAELTARKKQYNYYRDQLLSFDEGEVEWKMLGDLGENLDSKRKPITSGLREAGSIPYYGASGIVDYVKDYIFDGDFLLISEDGANLLARNTPIAFSISGKSWVNNHAHVIKFDSYAERRYVEYYLNSIDLAPYISGAAQPKLNKKNLESIRIPNPSPEDKERIVSILDKLEAITFSLTEGLPREIELRQKQYEYYRDLLFSFPKSEAASN
ncbi:restriction endonuclease subunit S [Citrobacter freundii]|uniref:restriction endonuclease subunit S n=1 Tax=Citrobacter freundii TaxID=546 RepID=UPI001C8C9A3A|nr:restriction endonuclease subunit S [Citrobacter freundii]MBX8659135.1 restriction endonuclease subunit S [Citrobacter freundii]